MHFADINNILSKLYCKDHINLDRAFDTFGTLGGGNHFIEIEEDSNKGLHLTIHSGSRNLGTQVYKYYQKELKLITITIQFINICIVFLRV